MLPARRNVRPRRHEALSGLPGTTRLSAANRGRMGVCLPCRRRTPAPVWALSKTLSRAMPGGCRNRAEPRIRSGSRSPTTWGSSTCSATCPNGAATHTSRTTTPMADPSLDDQGHVGDDHPARAPRGSLFQRRVVAAVRQPVVGACWEGDTVFRLPRCADAAGRGRAVRRMRRSSHHADLTFILINHFLALRCAGPLRPARARGATRRRAACSSLCPHRLKVFHVQSTLRMCERIHAADIWLSAGLLCSAMGRVPMEPARQHVRIRHELSGLLPDEVAKINAIRLAVCGHVHGVWLLVKSRFARFEAISLFHAHGRRLPLPIRCPQPRPA